MDNLFCIFCSDVSHNILNVIFLSFQMKPRRELSVGCAFTFLLLVGVSIAQDALFECPRGKTLMTSRLNLTAFFHSRKFKNYVPIFIPSFCQN